MDNSADLPILSKVARRVLAISGTSIRVMLKDCFLALVSYALISEIDLLRKPFNVLVRFITITQRSRHSNPHDQLTQMAEQDALQH